MTVSDLIEKLLQIPQDAEVFLEIKDTIAVDYESVTAKSIYIDGDDIVRITNVEGVF